MTQALLTPENSPRDIASLVGLTRAIRYRLALHMDMFPAGSDAAKGFVGATPEVQSTALAGALAARDGGPAPQQSHQAPQQAPAPMLPQGNVAPQPMMPPPMMGGQQNTGMAPPQIGGQAPGAIKRSPSTVSDPNNSGAQGGVGGGVDAAAIAMILKQLKAIKDEVDLCPGAGDLEEVAETVKGLARINKMMFILMLELAENALGMDKVTICGMIVSISDSGEFDNLLKAAAEGKS